MKESDRRLESESPNGNRPRQDGSRSKFDLVEQADEIQRIFQRAVQHELSIHKRLNNPVAFWKDGRVVIVPPEEIILPPDESETES